ncbi:MAG: hypothetical protein ACM3O6_02505 [Acidobacteriota bacterium]
MKSLGFFALAAIAAMAAAASAGAQSLKARQFQAQQDEYLAHSVDDTSKRCEATIAAKIDWPAIKQDEPGSSSPSGFCGEALNAIGSLCGQAMAKEAVQKGVKTLVCTMGGPRAISLKDGALTYTMDYDAANNEDFIKDFLKEHL